MFSSSSKDSKLPRISVKAVCASLAYLRRIVRKGNFLQDRPGEFSCLDLECLKTFVRVSTGQGPLAKCLRTVFNKANPSI